MIAFQARFFMLALLFTLALVLQPAPTSTTASATPTAGSAPSTTSGALTPEDAVRTLIASFITPGNTGTTCNALSGQFQGCPITPRLLARVQSATENGNIISRSQNTPQDVTIITLDNNGTTAHVNTVWRYGAFSYTIIFTVVNLGGGWLVDDSICANQPNSSIFNAPAGPCPASVVSGATPTTGTGGISTPVAKPSATPAVPGMPTTGSSNIPLAIIAALVAGVVTFAGVALSLRARTLSE